MSLVESFSHSLTVPHAHRHVAFRNASRLRSTAPLLLRDFKCRRHISVHAAENGPAAELPEVEDAKGAIAVGLGMYDKEDYESALQMFTKALDLPGTGIKRFRDKPPAISDGEKQAALYNIACCYSRMGNVEQGVQALAACMQAGYRDVQQIQVDADLDGLRDDPNYAKLMQRFQPRGGFGGLFGR